MTERCMLTDNQLSLLRGARDETALPPAIMRARGFWLDFEVLTVLGLVTSGGSRLSLTPIGEETLADIEQGGILDDYLAAQRIGRG